MKLRSLIVAAAVLVSAGSSLALAAGDAPKAAPKGAVTKTAATPAVAPAWTVDQRASTVSVGENTSGYGFGFERWTADIRFDPNNLAGSRATVTIDTTSVKSGDATNDATLKEGAWLDSRRYPQAVFQASGFRALGGNRYDAPGTLSLRGRTFPVTFTFTAAITGNQAQVQGQAQLDRTAMGFSVDPRFEWVSRLVNVRVNLRAARAG